MSQENEAPVIPPGYKQTDMGVFPKHWQVVDVGDLNPFVTSGSRGWARFYAETGAPFIRISNLTRQSIDLDLSNLKTVLLSPQGNAEVSRTQLQDGDILISITADIGIVGIVDSRVSKPAYMNQHIALIRFDKTLVCVRFVAYSLASERPQRLFVASMDIGAKAGMSLLTVRKIRLALPPFPEQRAIAEALSDVDQLLGSLEKLIAKKRAIKQAAMQQLLTGKTRLPGFSGEWETRRVYEFGDIVTGATPRTDIGAFWGEEYPWITPTDISSERDMISSERMITREGLNSIRMLPANSVLITCIASIGKNAILKTKGACNQQINAVVPSSAYSPEFLYYLFEFNPQYLLANAGTTATSIISKAAFCELTFEVPLLAEQFAIATVLSNMDAAIAALERRRDKTRAIKQGMMQALLTGRIRLFSDREGNDRGL